MIAMGICSWLNAAAYECQRRRKMGGSDRRRLVSPRLSQLSFGEIEEIRWEMDPTFTRPDVVSDPPVEDTPVREIFAVQTSACFSTVVVEYSVVSAFFFEVDWVMASQTFQGINPKVNRLFRFTLGQKLPDIGYYSDFAAAG
ncbi:hypothetical protein ACQ86E_31690 [Bradyrhizobium betae]|uniref:hypothetical protein n=1 Tax=Bradyrhizobium betae TaxID=244734 RepID=UPI003D66F18C